MNLLNLGKSVCFAAIIFAAIVCVRAQNENLESILQNANEQNQKYSEEFMNLLADEVKTFEIFDRRGIVKKRTVIESNFIILQTEKTPTRRVTGEYRSVVKVDGKEVGNVERRTTDLFEQLAKAKSAREELEKIQKESSRYDKNIEISGFTLLQSPVLDDNLREAFDFNLLSKETYENREVFVIEYRQIKQTPYIVVNQKNSADKGLVLVFELSLPDSFKKSDVILGGKLWIDAETFQLWREERKLIAQNNGNIVVLQKSEFEYQPSDFGILVPKQIIFTQNKAKKEADKFIENKEMSIRFQYSRFRKSNVDVQILDDDN